MRTRGGDGRRGAKRRLRGIDPSDAAPSVARNFVILNDQSEHLSKVVEALEAENYERVTPWQSNDWTFLWAYADPFTDSEHELGLTKEAVRANQLINRYPANFFSSKSTLVANDLPFIPTAFGMPDQFSAFEKAVDEHPQKVWVRKNCDHRGVMITNPSEVLSFLCTAEEEIFVQEFVNPPHLIHGRKWDIGVYVLVTSLKPLRIYVYDDLLLRFCKKDFPANEVVPSDVDTYVIADDYTSPWEADFFGSYVKRFEHVKDMLFQYCEDHHKEAKFPEQFRYGCLRAIYDVISMYAEAMLDGTEGWPDGQYQFFELYRFDFIFDDRLNVYLMEANMSPNLSPSAHPGLSDMFSRITTDVVSLLGFRDGPSCRLSLVKDPDRTKDSELKNRGAWVPITKDHVYADSADEPPSTPLLRSSGGPA